MKKIEKSNKILWTLIGIGSAILLLLILISSIIDIGERLSTIHIYVSYIYYVLIALIVIICIVFPIIHILSAPSFKLNNETDPIKQTKRKNSNYKTLKKIAKNIIENNDNIPDVRKAALSAVLSNKKELQKQLEPIINLYIKEEISKVINRNAANVFFKTAISQNSNLDALAIIMCNIQMVKEIVYISGYRPSNIKLNKLTFKILRNVLISYGINEGNVSDMVNKFLNSSTSFIPIIGSLVEMGVQGTVNAFLTARIGIQTRKFLFKEYHLANVIDNELEEKEAKTRISELKKEVEQMRKEDRQNKKEREKQVK